MGVEEAGTDVVGEDVVNALEDEESAGGVQPAKSSADKLSKAKDRFMMNATSLGDGKNPSYFYKYNMSFYRPLRTLFKIDIVNKKKTFLTLFPIFTGS